MLDRGGNAVDAAIAAAAVLAVTSPHMCGLGGDLFALVARPGEQPTGLNASGHAGSGADAARLRSQGVLVMPFEHDMRSVTVPGCVDGLVALQERYADLPLADLLRPAQLLAEHGFPVSPTLAEAALELGPDERRAAFGTPERLTVGQRLTMPGIDGALGAIASGGRVGFYEGPVGAELLALGSQEFGPADLRVRQADWVEPLRLRAFGHDLWTVPPNSQGYLALASAWIAEQVGLPDDPADGQWAFLLIESARQAAYDRPTVLHELAEGTALLAPARLGPRAAAIRDGASRGFADVYADGGTTHICAVDGDRSGVSLIMSNATEFGSRLLLPEHGIFLHNRGIGFTLEPGHPAEYGPGRRPPHTLAPLLITEPGGTLDTVLGTMGADAQPQVLLQLLVRMLDLAQDAGEAIAAPRWILSREPTTAFDTWSVGDPPLVRLELGAPAKWHSELRGQGYHVIEAERGDQSFGHAQVIRVARDGMLTGAADPRAGDSAIAGC
jgi:gamma-glutamyltranspeptidase / glutathione hydrolase